MMKRMTLFAVVALALNSVPGAALQAADAVKPVGFTPSQLKWITNPANAAVGMAVVWGDPDKGAFAAFNRFPAGFTAPLHTHTANTRIVVVQGTMSFAGADGKETKYPVGSYYTQPNTFPHVTKCLAGSECIIYIEGDAKWDLKPVEAPKK
jgi:anti-sigma factor ChrR (cupin superfamily)